MSDYELDVPHEFAGNWWLPEDPDNKVPGILTYDPSEGILLKLIGGWQYIVTRPVGNGVAFTGETRQWPVIFGIGDGKYITLLNAQVANAQTYDLGQILIGPNRLDLRAGTALIGCHMDEPDEPAFVACNATIENLTAWTHRSGIERQFEFTRDGRPERHAINLTHPDPISVSMASLTATLHFNWQSSVDNTRGGTTASVTEQASVEFSSNEPRSLAHWLDLLASMADLISISALRACGLITMQVSLPATPEEWPEDHPHRNEMHEIAVVQRRLVKAKPGQKAQAQRDLVLTLADLSFEELLPKWLEIRETFAAARQMILGLRYVTSGYLETRVVTAVAAAESMHRALNPDPPIPPEEFSTLRSQLLESVPPHRKAWLSDRLMSNEPTLKQRLLDLVARLGAVGEVLVPNPEEWAKAAKNSRNTLAHVGSSDGNDTERLFAVVEVTAAVVILNLLQELGVPEQRLLRGINDHSTLSRAKELATVILKKG